MRLSSKHMVFSLLSVFILTISLNSCVDEYFPEIDKYENLLVIDGAITNQPGPYEIRLSLSSSVERPGFLPYTGAQVIVEDNQGNEEVFTEIEPGIHVSTVDGLQGVIGLKYRIVIRTPDEKEFQSSFQELKKPVEIANVYAEVYSKETGDEYRPEYGYQFYVDSEPAETDSAYLMWRAKGAYKYQSDFLIRYIYDKRVLSVFPKSDSLYTCYHDDIYTGIYTLDMSKLSAPEVNRFPLNYVNTNTRKLSIRYSLFVKQYTITEGAYDYYSRLKDVNTQQGSLYTQQPYQIKGNVYDVLDTQYPILGYFLVAGVKEKRIFVDRPPSIQVEFYYGICEIGDGDYDAYGYIRWTPSNTWPLYVTTDVNRRRALMHQGCVDCRWWGGIIDKPDFWKD